MEGMLVSGAAAEKDVICISLIGVKDVPGKAAQIFEILAESGVNIDLILQSIGREGSKDITFVIKSQYREKAFEIIQKKIGNEVFDHMITDEDVAKVSIRGTGMMSNAQVAANMFEAMYNVGVNIKMIFTSEIKLTVLVAEDDMTLALKAVRNKFLED